MQTNIESLLHFSSFFDIISSYDYHFSVSLEIEKKEIELNYDDLEFSSVSPSYCIIGQEKALGLLRLGLSMSRPGYNIFVSGDDGSGRLTAIKEEIKKIEEDTSYLLDVAYLHNQSHPERPICFCFPQGKAKEFQSDLDALKDNKRQKKPSVTNGRTQDSSSS